MLVLKVSVTRSPAPPNILLPLKAVDPPTPLTKHHEAKPTQKTPPQQIKAGAFQTKAVRRFPSHIPVL